MLYFLAGALIGALITLVLYSSVACNRITSLESEINRRADYADKNI